MQIVEQESLTPVERIDRPAVICVAAWFGKVRLIDNIELQAPSWDLEIEWASNEYVFIEGGFLFCTNT